MALPRLRPVPGFLLALSVLAELAAVPLSWGLEPAWDTLLLAVSSPVTTAAGALILSRHPRHAIGWLLVAQGLVAALGGDLAQGWGQRAADQDWPLGPPAEFVATGSWLPTAPLAVAVLLLFPTGRLLARRWSLVLALSVVGVLAAEPGWVLNPDAGSEYVAGRNPYAVDWLPTEVLFVGGFAIVAVSLLPGLVAVVVRFRTSSEVERLQLKWFALASGALAIGLPLGGALWWVTPVVHVIPALVVTIWPIAICVAILRYRLYDVDLVISRTFSYATLTLLLAAVYAGAVVVLGAVVGRDSAWVTAGATLLAAAVFRLAHRRVQDAGRPALPSAAFRRAGRVTAVRRRPAPRPSRARGRGGRPSCGDAGSRPRAEVRAAARRASGRRARAAATAVAPGRETVPVLRGGTTLARSSGRRAVTPTGPCCRRSSTRRRSRSRWPGSGWSCDSAWTRSTSPRSHCGGRRRRAPAPGTRPARRRPAAAGLDRPRDAARAARARRSSRGGAPDAGRCRHGDQRCDRRAPLPGARPAPGPSAGRSRSGPARAGQPVAGAGRRFGDERPVPLGCRGRGVLRGLRGIDQCRQARPRRRGTARSRAPRLDPGGKCRRRRCGRCGDRSRVRADRSVRPRCRARRATPVESVRGRGTTLSAELPCVS